MKILGYLIHTNATIPVRVLLGNIEARPTDGLANLHCPIFQRAGVFKVSRQNNKLIVRSDRRLAVPDNQQCAQNSNVVALRGRTIAFQRRVSFYRQWKCRWNRKGVDRGSKKLWRWNRYYGLRRAVRTSPTGRFLCNCAWPNGRETEKYSCYEKPHDDLVDTRQFVTGGECSV
jgi:hypothetical protein